jgi:hypothetical protein
MHGLFNIDFGGAIWTAKLLCVGSLPRTCYDLSRNKILVKSLLKLITVQRSAVQRGPSLASLEEIIYDRILARPP